MEIGSEKFYWAIAIAILLGGTLAYIFWRERRRVKLGIKEAAPVDTASANLVQLQLNAYERLILLTERIALPNLISRTNQPGLSAREMQFLLTGSIKQEFEHNVTQQLYVSAESWEALRNLKEQNIHIVNQVASFLPEDASSNDLNRSLLEMIAQNPKVSLHSVVAEVLSYEAKKILQR